MPTEDGRKERRHSSGHRKRSRSPDDRDSSRKSNRNEDGHERGQRRRSEVSSVVNDRLAAGSRGIGRTAMPVSTTSGSTHRHGSCFAPRSLLYVFRSCSCRQEPDVVPRRPPRQDWAKDENGYWSKHIFKVADNPHLHQLSENELQVGNLFYRKSVRKEVFSRPLS